MDGGSPVPFVARSEVRRDVLSALATEARSAPALVAALPISKSGVYKALDELADRGLVTETGDEWQVTAAGRLVADELERHDRLDALLADREYWLNHDFSGFPDRFRRQLASLADVEVLRNPGSDPRYLERYWVDRMPDADRLWVGSRVIHRRYADAMDDQALDSGDTRLITHAPLFKRFVERSDLDPEALTRNRPDAIEYRVCDIPCSFMLTEDLFTLSFPTHDGEYDQDSVLVCRGETALRFGRDLFSYYWDRAESVAAYFEG